MPRTPKPSGRRQGKGYGDRRVANREPIQRFLIVCEGEKTEPHYFNNFHVPSSLVLNVLGIARDPLRLVSRAIHERQAEQYDQVWCVFDKDETPPDPFNQAIQEAERAGIHVAYSVQAFELWYLLHFDYVDVATPRVDYITRLREKLGWPYAKNEATLYRELRPRQEVAMRHAKTLQAQYTSRNPAEHDPSTTVHLLVAELNRFTPQSRFGDGESTSSS